MPRCQDRVGPDALTEQIVVAVRGVNLHNPAGVAGECVAGGR